LWPWCVASRWQKTHHQAFAVISDDSDFFIFDGVPRLMPLRSIRLGNPSLAFWSRASVFRHLNLQPTLQHAVLLAAQLGCDVCGRSHGVFKSALNIRQMSHRVSAETLARVALFYQEQHDTVSAELDECRQDAMVQSIVRLGRVIRGIAVQNPMPATRQSQHVLKPLRRRVYRRLGVAHVSETLACDVDSSQSCERRFVTDLWSNHCVVLAAEDADNDPLPVPSLDPLELAQQVITLLNATDDELVPPLHAEALLMQISHRHQLQSDLGVVPKLEHVHTRNLFIQAVRWFTLGLEAPPIWTLFSGPKFHQACRVLEQQQCQLPPHSLSVKQPSVQFASSTLSSSSSSSSPSSSSSSSTVGEVPLLHVPAWPSLDELTTVVAEILRAHDGRVARNWFANHFKEATDSQWMPKVWRIRYIKDLATFCAHSAGQFKLCGTWVVLCDGAAVPTHWEDDFES
jgi:hypothetical protein